MVFLLLPITGYWEKGRLRRFHELLYNRIKNILSCHSVISIKDKKKYVPKHDQDYWIMVVLIVCRSLIDDICDYSDDYDRLLLFAQKDSFIFGWGLFLFF